MINFKFEHKDKALFCKIDYNWLLHEITEIYIHVDVTDDYHRLSDYTEDNKLLGALYSNIARQFLLSRKRSS